MKINKKKKKKKNYRGDYLWQLVPQRAPILEL